MTLLLKAANVERYCSLSILQIPFKSGLNKWPAILISKTCVSRSTEMESCHKNVICQTLMRVLVLSSWFLL